MSRASNTINASDRSTTPIKLRYTSSYNSQYFANYGISILSGVNGSVTITGSVPQTTLNYYLAKQLYYSNYTTGSFPVSASSFDNFLQSTAASGTFDADIRYFPTESNSNIAIVSIPRSIYGENIARGGFVVDTYFPTTKHISDDGNGNIIDYTDPVSPVHVGNVLYNQGIAVITNSYYLTYVNSVVNYILTITAESTVYQNEVRCHVSENDFNYSLNPSVYSESNFSTSSASPIIFSALGQSSGFSYIASGNLRNELTGSDFSPFATTVGLYNDKDELLVVGKLATPYPIPSNTDMTFVVRYDS